MTEKDTFYKLTTKEFVRTRFQKMLEEVAEQSLILVIAPSGYGKSTVVRQFFNDHKEKKSIWFLFQRDEVDEIWTWSRMCDKVMEWNEELCEKLSEIGLPKSGQERNYVIRMIKQYITSPVYFVLDDYQNCKSKEINRLLELIVQENTFLHIILISREFPDISNEEMFLKGQCAVFDQNSLTLTMKETEEIFRLYEITLKREELEKLYQYTDGWISAVYLSLYEYKKSGDFGCFYGVNHLLKTAIFDKLTPKMQEFYMKIAPFDGFDIEGASYITEIEVTDLMLRENKEQFGFLHYDEKSQSFTMHALLRSVAEKELEKSGIDIERLYHRAAYWCEKKKRFVHAVRYYQKEKNWEKIAQLYAGEYGRNIIEQAPELFDEIREYIRPEIWDRYIMAMLNHRYYLAAKEQAEKLMPEYEQALLQVKESKKWSTNDRVAGEMKVILSVMQFNDIKRMNQTLREACELIQSGTSVLIENSPLTYGTACMTVLYYKQSGKLLETIQQEKEYAGYYTKLATGSREDWDTFFDAEYAMLTGQMDKAGALAGKVLKTAKLCRQNCIIISCYYIILRSMIYNGQKMEFENLINEMEEDLRDIATPVLCADIELVQGYMYACLGKFEKVAEWLRDFKLENCSRQIRSSRGGCMTYGKILCGLENWEMLEFIGTQMLKPYQQTIQIRSQVVGLLYKAIARYHIGEEEIAASFLLQAVQLAEPDNLQIPFIENGKEIEPLLPIIGENAFLKKTSYGMEKYKKGILSFKESTKKEKPLLTKREQEIMGYVRAGLRNAQISEKMHIAQVTVEKNLTKIYRKLGVANRTAAIRKMEEMDSLK